VSKEILNAFVLVDTGLSKTTENFSTKNSILYQQFDKAAVENPNKVTAWKNKADEVKKRSNELYTLLQDLKIEIITSAGSKEAVEKNKIDGNKIESKDNMDKPAEIMIVKGKGKVLKAKIEDFRNYLIQLSEGDPELIKSINTTLDTRPPELSGTKEGDKKTWEVEHFEGLPLIAVTTLMSKMQADIRNAESDIVQFLYSKIDAGSFKFNKLDATIIPNSNYIIRGSEYKAEVFIAAFDTTQEPEIFIGTTEKYTNEAGVLDYRMAGKFDKLEIDKNTKKGIFRRVGSTLGNNKWSGLIQLKALGGTMIRRPFTAEFTVAEPQAVISPTKMNVFYIAVDNPVAISVPGVPSDKVFATSSNGVLVRDGKNWVARPKSPGNALIQVEAEIDGKRQNMGYMEFRVKNIPDPVAKIGSKKGGKMDKGSLLLQQIVQADLENFEFDAKFQVTEFNLSASIKGFLQEGNSKGQRITEQQKEIIKNTNKGDKLFISNIWAVGPDGKPRELNGIILTVQ
jgi:gliding motility-associated protein GldM